MKIILFILPVSLFPKTSESVSFKPVQIQHLCSYTSDMSHAGSAFERSPSWLLSPTHWPPFRGLGRSMLIVDDSMTRWPNCPCFGSWIKAALLQGRQISGQIQHLFNASRSIGSLNQYGYPEYLMICLHEYIVEKQFGNRLESMNTQRSLLERLGQYQGTSKFRFASTDAFFKYPEHQNIVFLKANSPKTCYVSSWMSSDGILSMKKFNCARDCACLLSPQYSVPAYQQKYLNSCINQTNCCNCLISSQVSRVVLGPSRDSKANWMRSAWFSGSLHSPNWSTAILSHVNIEMSCLVGQKASIITTDCSLVSPFQEININKEITYWNKISQIPIHWET